MPGFNRLKPASPLAGRLKLATLTPGDCDQFCDVQVGCVAWTLTTSDNVNMPGHCILYSKVRLIQGTKEKQGTIRIISPVQHFF